jgi:hypothetical protein
MDVNLNNRRKKGGSRILRRCEDILLACTQCFRGGRFVFCLQINRLRDFDGLPRHRVHSINCCDVAVPCISGWAR